MEIPRAPIGGVSQRAAAVAGAINPTQRAIAKTATERAAGRDLMGAGETLQALTQRVADERETAENREDIIDTQMEGARILKEWKDRIGAPGYEYSEADDEELDAALQTVADSARHDSGRFAARRMLQGEQIRFMEKRDAGLQATAERNARDAAREGAQYALSIGNFDLAENAADMGRQLGASIEWADSVKRGADMGRGMEAFNEAWDESKTFEENVEAATKFIDGYSNRSNIIPANRDAAVRAMRTELGIREKAHKSQLLAAEQFSQAEALDNYRQTQRAINTGEPYTEDQINLMYDAGAFGDTDSTTAVSYKNNLIDSLNKVDRRAVDLANILAGNDAVAPAVNTEASSEASQLSYEMAVSRGADEDVAAADAARQTGRVPRSTEIQVERGWRSATDDNLQSFTESLSNYANIQNNNPGAYWSLDRDTRTAMATGYTMLRGMTPEQQAAAAPRVAARVHQMMNVDDETRNNRRQHWNSTFKRNAALELQRRAKETPELSVPGMLWGRNVPESMPLQMREYFADLARTAYMTTGDVEGAWETAIHDTRNTWVATDINEDVEGFDGDDVGTQWQWQGIPSDQAPAYRGAMSKDIAGEAFILSDGTEHTFKPSEAKDVAINPFEPPRYTSEGQQVYRLSYKGQPLMGPDGPQRWYPRFD